MYLRVSKEIILWTAVMTPVPALSHVTSQKKPTQLIPLNEVYPGMGQALLVPNLLYRDALIVYRRRLLPY